MVNSIYHKSLCLAKLYKCVHKYNQEDYNLNICGLKWRGFKGRERPEFGYIVEVNIRYSH